MSKQSMGVVGLAVMGENLALNIEHKGFPVSVYNRTKARTKKFAEGKACCKNVVPNYSIKELVNSLERPRKVMLMVKAGEAVDSMIRKIKPHLSRGDILIDGGNSFFEDTARRGEKLAKEGILYIGTGVSGGEEGALKGPCIMPGGPKKAYEELEPILTKIAAQTEDGPCCTYIGPGAAGHYVKMVHNGIEYGDMELIAEAYDIMKNTLGLEAAELHEIFSKWNEGDLNSYLVGITADILAVTDEDTGKPLVDMILDKAGQKGTGKWTSQSALDLGVPTPTINAAVESRIISAYKDERVAASKLPSGPKKKFDGDKRKLIKSVHDALHASKITSYAQGMALLREASKEYQFNLNFAEIARIWKGGCIIRAKLLDPIREAYKSNADLPNLLVDPFFSGVVKKLQNNWRYAVQTANALGTPCLAISASLSYFDAYRRATVPANVIQAQRDYFGAHTYERTDKKGKFHNKGWLERRCCEEK